MSRAMNPFHLLARKLKRWMSNHSLAASTAEWVLFWHLLGRQFVDARLERSYTCPVWRRSQVERHGTANPRLSGSNPLAASSGAGVVSSAGRAHA